MSNISTLQPTHTLPGVLLSDTTIKQLATEAGLSTTDATMIRSVRGAIQHLVRQGNTTLRFALGMEGDYDLINLQQLDLVLGTPSLRSELPSSDDPIDACRKLVAKLRLVWLDHHTVRYYTDQMSLPAETVTAVMRVVYHIGRALEQDDDETLDPLRAQLAKPPLRDPEGGQTIINHKMLSHITSDPTGQDLSLKLFGAGVGMRTAYDLQTTRKFLTRLLQELT